MTWSVFKVLSTRRETRFPSLGQEDPLEKGMATHFSILAWKIPAGYSIIGLQESDTTERLAL